MFSAAVGVIMATSSAAFSLSPAQLAHAEARSQQIREKIEAAVPDDGGFRSTLVKRSIYLIHHQNELGSKRRDGYLSFDDYVSLQWAGFLLDTPPGSKVVNRQDFLDGFLGRPGEANNGWDIPGYKEPIIALYNRIDVYKKRDT